MCEFFSLLSNGKGKIFYCDAEARETAKLKGENPDSHTYIAEQFNFKGAREDCLNKWEYDVINGKLRVDTMNTTDDSDKVLAAIKKLDMHVVAPNEMKALDAEIERQRKAEEERQRQLEEKKRKEEEAAAIEAKRVEKEIRLKEKYVGRWMRFKVDAELADLCGTNWDIDASCGGKRPEGYKHVYWHEDMNPLFGRQFVVNDVKVRDDGIVELFDQYFYRGVTVVDWMLTDAPTVTSFR